MLMLRSADANLSDKQFHVTAFLLDYIAIVRDQIPVMKQKINSSKT